MNITSLIVLEAIIVKNQRQHLGVEVIQSLDVGIIITGVEMVVAPNMDFVKREILLGFTSKLGSGSGGVLVGRSLD
jgi:hypothetical protein